MYIISGRGRKSGGARATGATASLAPLDTVHKYSFADQMFEHLKLRILFRPLLIKYYFTAM